MRGPCRPSDGSRARLRQKQLSQPLAKRLNALRMDQDQVRFYSLPPYQFHHDDTINVARRRTMHDHQLSTSMPVSMS